jgi:hypothetical protein
MSFILFDTGKEEIVGTGLEFIVGRGGWGLGGCLGGYLHEGKRWKL